MNNDINMKHTSCLWIRYVREPEKWLKTGLLYSLFSFYHRSVRCKIAASRSPPFFCVKLAAMYTVCFIETGFTLTRIECKEHYFWNFFLHILLFCSLLCHEVGSKLSMLGHPSISIYHNTNLLCCVQTILMTFSASS